MMRQLRPPELLQQIVDAIQAGGWSYTVMRSNSLPFRITITNGTEIQNLVIYIWNVGTGGKTRSEDEYRIQLKGEPPLRTDSRFKTLLLGWFEASKVFVAFDAFKHREFSGRSPSVQVPKHTVDAAARNKVAFHTKVLKRVKGKEVVVAFQKDYLIQYINDIYPEYHASSAEGISDVEAEVIERSRIDQPIPDKALEGLPAKRTMALRQMNVKVRERGFSENVWRLYNGKCVICGLQADITEASHIKDVEFDGTDEITNGIQLCRNHHKAYDNGLFGIGSDSTVILNEKHVAKLRNLGLDSRLDEFIQTLRVGEKITPPRDAKFGPNPEYLAEKCTLKGIQPTLR